MRRLLVTAAAFAAIAALAFASGAEAGSLARLVAPPSACPDQGNLGAPAGAKEKAMLCMVDFARRRAGHSALRDDGELDTSSLRKSGDILRCDSFSHEACGRDFTYWMRRTGYLPASCWRAGENIAWGSGSYGTVRSIFVAWIHSQGHRENILGPYSQTGIGLRVGSLDGHREAHVWTEHFGTHC